MLSYFLVDNQTLIKNLKQKFKYLLNQWLKNIQNMPNILKCNMCNEKEIYIGKIIGVTVKGFKAWIKQQISDYKIGKSKPFFLCVVLKIIVYRTICLKLKHF